MSWIQKQNKEKFRQTKNKMERNLEREKMDSKTLNFIKNFQNVLIKLWYFEFDLVGSKKYKYR